VEEKELGSLGRDRGGMLIKTDVLGGIHRIIWGDAHSGFRQLSFNSYREFRELVLFV